MQLLPKLLVARQGRGSLRPLVPTPDGRGGLTESVVSKVCLVQFENSGIWNLDLILTKALKEANHHGSVPPNAEYLGGRRCRCRLSPVVTRQLTTFLRPVDVVEQREQQLSLSAAVKDDAGFADSPQSNAGLPH